MQSACPACGRAAEVESGSAVRCAGCDADYWAIAGQARGERFTGDATVPEGSLAAAWAVTAAVGVLVALLALVAAEVACVALLVAWLVG